MNELQWKPVSTFAFAACTLMTLLIAYLSNTGSKWIPILDSANLMFHEAGHPIFGLLSERLQIYGGTLGQLSFPLATFICFWRQRDSVATYLCALWFVQNLWNIARYIADARVQLLPLVGGGEHDWAEILGRWNVLKMDVQFARAFIFFGFVIIFFIWRSLFEQWKISNHTPRLGSWPKI